MAVKFACAALVLLSAAGFAFGAWGLFTSAGRRTFDEMDGLYPFFSLVGAGVLLIVAIILAIVAYLRASKRA